MEVFTMIKYLDAPRAAITRSDGLLPVPGRRMNGLLAGRILPFVSIFYASGCGRCRPRWRPFSQAVTGSMPALVKVDSIEALTSDPRPITTPRPIQRDERRERLHDRGRHIPVCAMSRRLHRMSHIEI